MGDQLRAGERTIRELVIFNDEEITDDRIEERAQQFLKQVEAVRKARAQLREVRREAGARSEEGQAEVPPRALEARCARSRDVAADSQDRVHRDVKRKLIDEVKDIVDDVSRVQRELDAIERVLNPKIKAKAPKLKEEERKNLLKQQKDLRAESQAADRRPRGEPERLRHTIETIQRARRRPNRRRRSWSKPTSVSSSRSRRSTRTAGCSSSI